MEKRILGLVLSILLLVGTIPARAQAQENEEMEILYIGKAENLTSYKKGLNLDTTEVITKDILTDYMNIIVDKEFMNASNQKALIDAFYGNKRILVLGRISESEILDYFAIGKKERIEQQDDFEQECFLEVIEVEDENGNVTTKQLESIGKLLYQDMVGGGFF